jgi:hypothetical protein
MKCIQTFPPLIGDMYINHNYISYLSQIYCIWTWTQVWGLGPQWANRTVCPLVRTRYTWSNFNWCVQRNHVFIVPRLKSTCGAMHNCCKRVFVLVTLLCLDICVGFFKNVWFFHVFCYAWCFGFSFFWFSFGNFLMLYIYLWRLCIYIFLFCLVVLITFLSCSGLYCFSNGVYVWRVYL